MLLGGLGVVLLVVVLAQGFGQDPRQIDSPLVGQPAPRFELHDLAGERFALDNVRGRPVLINFWATWCPPCVAEHSSLQRLARRFENRVEFVGVIYQDEESLIRDFLSQRGAWGRTLDDPGSLTAIRYGVFGAPETFIIDADGVIVHKITGQLDEANVSRLLGDLL